MVVVLEASLAVWPEVWLEASLEVSLAVALMGWHWWR